MKPIQVVIFCAFWLPCLVLGQQSNDDFQELKQWLVLQGATVKMDLRSDAFNHGGVSVRGMLATDELPDQTTFLVIPKRLWLVLSNFPKFAEAHVRVPLKCDRLVKEHELKLAAALASEAQKGNASFYSEYLKTLPTMEQFHSFYPFMMESPLQSDFASLPIVADVQSSQEDLKLVQACFDKWAKVPESLVRDLTWDQILLGLTWLRTRAFTMFQYFGTQDIIALIPGADMLNTAKDGDLNVAWSSSETEYTMSTDSKSVASGAELLDSYCQGEEEGRQCHNSEMLKHWGVYLEDNPNSADHDADTCTGEAGIHLKEVTQSALQDPATALSAGWRSPRCRATTLNMAQGPLRCSLSRLAWETCAEEWGAAPSPNGKPLKISLSMSGRSAEPSPSKTRPPIPGKNSGGLSPKAGQLRGRQAAMQKLFDSER